MTLDNTVQLSLSATEALLAWTQTVQNEANSSFAAAQQIVRRLGAQWQNGRTTFGFWIPEISSDTDVYLQILRPSNPINFQADQQTISFQQHKIKLLREGDYAWGVLDGLIAGTEQQTGDFYRLCYQDNDSNWHKIYDPLAHSLPFGAFAPAELYDMAGMLAQRTDQAHFANLNTTDDADGIPRINGPINILQLHPNTATADGSLAGLARLYQQIAHKVKNNQPLTPAEQNYIAYDAIQLMPIEPTIEFEAGTSFWQEALVSPPKGETEEGDISKISVTLHKPTMTNWGYDIVIAGSPAVNPRVLESKRPSEFLHLIETLHNFPGKPIAVVLDIVYGHADNQALPLLNSHFFPGANMYGQNLRYEHPVVRALLLEMQRRKSDFGVDGIRVDGAQDFKNWDSETDTMWHDDDYLQLMNDIVQEAAGVQYRPWMIFEDGRPWPRADWELASTYREVTKQFPNVVQWGPLTFAHNTPFLFTFWISKWWRVKEIMEVGQHWITGCANHDTLRRGTQVDPQARINTYLGKTLPDIFKNAYDNAAATLFTYAFAPGIPMDFINALTRAPWSFIRNTDDRYGVKVVSEEARFLHWAVNEASFNRPDLFARLKALGFTTLNELRHFLHSLDHAVQVTGYDLPTMSAILDDVQPPLNGRPFTPASLKTIARAWMDDVHDYCNVSHWQDNVDPIRSQYNHSLRQFRRQRPWLQQNLSPTDHFAYLHPTNGSILFYGLRTAPNGRQQLLFLANMEGAPLTITPTALPIPNLPQTDWQPTLASPHLPATPAHQPLTLADSQGIVFTRG